MSDVLDGLSEVDSNKVLDGDGVLNGPSVSKLPQFHAILRSVTDESLFELLAFSYEEANVYAKFEASSTKIPSSSAAQLLVNQSESVPS